MNPTSRSMSAPIFQQNYSLDTLASVASGQSNDTTAAKEVNAVNRHTKSVEFYGSSSSMSLLSRVQANEKSTAQLQEVEEDGASLVSQLHNPSFFSSPPVTENHSEIQGNSSPQQCRTFLNAFFGSIHYIHPILDKNSFLTRCEELWSGSSPSQGRSFMALYYSLLSLGALVGPRDEEYSANSGTSLNLEWSRKFFDKARALCCELSMTTDLEMVQCFFFMVRRPTTHLKSNS